MPKKEANKKQGKEKRHFMKDFKAELKRVIWPTPKQLLNNTVAVITVVLITAAIVFVLDFVFESMNTYGIDQIKSMVDSSNTVDSNSVDDATSTEDTNTESSEDTANETEENTVSEESNNVEE